MPRVFLMDAQRLQNIKRSKDKTYDAVIAEIERNAQKALRSGTYSVTTKSAVPPSGDKHDYISQAPYFWADPSKKDGLPYIRRDGERNPEIKKYPDHDSLDKMGSAVESLALAYYFSGDEAYAAKADQLLKTWFIDAATRMNPNLEYAQYIPGVNTGRGIGLIETRGLTRVVDAVGLLSGSKSLTDADKRGVEDWFSKFLTWMQESKNGRDESASKNNHGTIYDVQTVSYALFIGKRDLAKKVLETAKQKRIAFQIEPDGRQPLELARTRAWSYSIMNLAGLMDLAALGENVGVDLWNFETRDGRSIRHALDYLYPFSTGEKWKYQQLGEFQPQALFPLMRRAAAHFHDDKFKAMMAKIPAAEPSAKESLLAVQARSALDVAAFDRARILKAADQYLKEKPVTITASRSPRSAGGLHDFFSEGDYWWPDPKDRDAPYIQRDGMTNPDNFTAHREAMMRLSVQVPALTAAWLVTGKRKYADHAALHLRAWFISDATRMNPNLEFAQAIKGRFTGRGIGIIDTIHLVEVARAVEVLERSGALSASDTAAIKKWFTDYLTWMTTSKNGIDEREAKNNHGTCWVMQAAAFAHLVGDQKLLDYCRVRFKTVLVPNQIDKDGSFPQEMRRTKPYGYSLFNLEAMSTVAQILSTPQDNLWTFETADGRGLALAVKFMYPYIRDKKTFPKPADVMYYNEWPMRQTSLLFGGMALDKPEYIELWKTLPADSQVEEVIRNFFIRQPVLWVGKSAK